jgi:DNA-directed RNA polymerase subunit RPC12/RpoP
MSTAVSSATAAAPLVAPPLRRLWCALRGHAIDNRVFRDNGRRCLRCGTEILQDDGSPTHVGHTFSCFFGGHTYRKGGMRDGHQEYLCVRCGHPLLFHAESDPYSARGAFKKRVRYLCGLTGHRVHEVARRAGGMEFACHCGHSFIRGIRPTTRIRHPLVCVFFGHAVGFIATRYGQSEFVCTNCGHTFFFH